MITKNLERLKINSINTFLKNRLAVSIRSASYNHDRYSYSIKENPDHKYLLTPKNYKIPSYLSPEEIEATKSCQYPKHRLDYFAITISNY